MTIWLTLTPLTALFWMACAVMVLPEMLGTFFQRERQAARQKDDGTERVLLAGTFVSQILAWNIARRWTTGRRWGRRSARSTRPTATQRSG